MPQKKTPKKKTKNKETENHHNMRALWKGSISFGLVNIPVKMYVASREHDLKFVMLHKKDLSQVRFARFCKAEEKEIPYEEIVKGYEYAPYDFVVVTAEDFSKINLNKSKSIEILNFIEEVEIDTIYYSRPYYLEPEKNAQRAYALLLEAMKKSKKIGIAKFVIHNRKHLAVIKPYENGIVLNELRYDAEIVNLSNLKLPEAASSSKEELSIALKLIDHLTTHFKPASYTDTYESEVMKMIKQKAKGKKVHPIGQEKKTSKVHDIIALLKESLNEDKKTKPPELKQTEKLKPAKKRKAS